MLVAAQFMERIRKLPFNESHNVDHPISLYAATKKSNELIAHVYSHLFNLPTTGLRFYCIWTMGEARYGTL